ncbi:MAG: hypothetical protein M3044_03325 [Thermoproteota archaeon]|nr:hypothetical protein [Thermoproteota archaeon]
MELFFYYRDPQFGYLIDYTSDWNGLHFTCEPNTEYIYIYDRVNVLQYRLYAVFLPGVISCGSFRLFYASVANGGQGASCGAANNGGIGSGESGPSCFSSNQNVQAQPRAQSPQAQPPTAFAANTR